jgi:DnaJ-class molecular chaperone
MTQRETLYKTPSVKHYDDGYMECPACEGLGRVSYMSGLFLNGDGTWMMIACPLCHGDGQVPVVSEDKDGEE